MKKSFKLKRNTIVFTLLSAITLSGCNVSPSNGLTEDASSNGIYLESTGEDEFYSIKKLDVDSMQKNTYKIDEYDIVNYSIVCTPDDFGKYVGESNCSYSIVKNTLSQTELPDNIKSIVLAGLDKLETLKFGVNLSVLNYNLKNLKVEYIDDISVQVAAYFDSINHTIQLNRSVNNQTSDLYSKIVLHEILGHGMTLAYTESNGGVLCDLAIPAIMDNNVSKNYFKVGYSMNEAIAELISCYASGKQINCMDGVYAVSTSELLMFLKSTNIKVSEFANKGVPYLVSKMHKEGIDIPMSFIHSCDIKLLSTMKGLDSSNITGAQTLMYTYLALYSTDKKEKNISDDEINNQLISIIDSYNGMIEPINIDGEITIMSGVDAIYVNNLKESIVEYNKSNTKKLTNN